MTFILKKILEYIAMAGAFLQCFFSTWVLLYKDYFSHWVKYLPLLYGIFFIFFPSFSNCVSDIKLNDEQRSYLVKLINNNRLFPVFFEHYNIGNAVSDLNLTQQHNLVKNILRDCANSGNINCADLRVNLGNTATRYIVNTFLISPHREYIGIVNLTKFYERSLTAQNAASLSNLNSTTSSLSSGQSSSTTVPFSSPQQDSFSSVADLNGQVNDLSEVGTSPWLIAGGILLVFAAIAGCFILYKKTYGKQCSSKPDDSEDKLGTTEFNGDKVSSDMDSLIINDDNCGLIEEGNPDNLGGDNLSWIFNNKGYDNYYTFFVNHSVPLVVIFLFLSYFFIIWLFFFKKKKR